MYILVHIYIFSLNYAMPKLYGLIFSGCMFYISFKIIV